MPQRPLVRRLGPFRRRGDHRLERHRRRHSLHAAAGRGQHPQPALFLLIWIVGGALAFAGAMAYAELAAVRPRAGGEYVYLDAAFGRLAAFLTGWTSFVAGFSGAIAASAVVFASYLGRFVAGASDGTPLVTVPIPWVPLTVSRQTLVAVSLIALMAWIHVRGVGPGRIVGNALAALKVSAIVMFIALGFRSAPAPPPIWSRPPAPCAQPRGCWRSCR